MADKQKVLVIEDDEAISALYGEKLTLEGFAVTRMLDGESGFSSALQEKPDCILLDIILPEIDGFEVLRRLKADAKTSSIPVILLSNLSQPEHVKRGKELGAVEYMVKADYVPSQVVAKVRETIGNG